MCGSTIYTVDKLLVPPVGNLFQMLSNNPAYSRFLDLVKAANLSETVNLPARTLIVPRNQAFDNLDDEVLDHALQMCSDSDSFLFVAGSRSVGEGTRLCQRDG